MLEFTSALYLGQTHPTESLRPWPQLSLGRPAVLGEPTGAARVARRLAALQGCQRAILGTSTLHLFFDLCGALAECGAAFLVDDGSYPIARWAVQRATAMGAPTRTFGHHDLAGLRRALAGVARRGRQPVVVVDGYCPGCGPAPLSQYLEATREFGGIVLIDDTQAWGLLGEGPTAQLPYGRGGGGSFRFQNVFAPEAIMVCSWAKAFGVPIASLSSSRSLVEFFRQASRTRIHCSPPSLASLAAAEHALDVNLRAGDSLRLRLALRVKRFRRRLHDAGVRAEGGLFPVQSVVPGSDREAEWVSRRLPASGLKALLQGGCRERSRITLLITARHRPADIDNAAQILLEALLSAKRHRIAAFSGNVGVEG